MIEKIEKHQALVNLVFTFFLIGANLLLWNTARDAVREARRASQGTLLATLNRDFFFEGRMYRIRQVIESKKPILKRHKGKFSDQDVEDYIGYLDMIQGFVDRNILDCGLVMDNFAYYAEEAYQNKEIRDYIANQRRELKDDTVYSGFEKLAKENEVCKR